MDESRHTPRIKRVFELAELEAKRLHHTYLGTEHLLLGILREGQSTAARILKARGLTLATARHGVVFFMGLGEKKRGKA